MQADLLQSLQASTSLRRQPSRRHLVYRLVLDDGRPAWWKQFQSEGPDHVEALAPREAAAIGTCARLLGRRVVPELLAQDPEGRWLLLSEVGTPRTSLRRATAEGRLSGADAARLGRTMARLHAAGREAPVCSWLAPGTAERAWWRRQSPEASALRPTLGPSASRGEWLILGDPDPDDIFIDEVGVHLVDLELAGPGDRARDLGTLAARWVPLCDQIATAGAFLAGYRELLPLDAATSRRASRYAGIALSAEGDRRFARLAHELLHGEDCPLEATCRALHYLASKRSIHR